MNREEKNLLISLCEHIGRLAPLWTQGPGGNVSIKTADGALWIKASGKRLADINKPQGVASMEKKGFATTLQELSDRGGQSEERYSELLKKYSLKASDLGRASMEAGFHALLSKPIVLHFHSLAAVLMAHEFKKQAPRVMAFFESLGGKSFSPQFIPQIMPGLELSLHLAGFPNRELFILENHGVVIQTEDENILDSWLKVEIQFCEKFGYGELAELLRGSLVASDGPHSVLASTRNWLKEDLGPKPMPIKIYFPDSAVFLSRLMACLRPVGGGLFELLADAEELDQDGVEIWLATQALYKLCPDLGELSEQVASHVAKLPTEKYRALLGNGTKGRND